MPLHIRIRVRVGIYLLLVYIGFLLVFGFVFVSDLAFVPVPLELQHVSYFDVHVCRVGSLLNVEVERRKLTLTIIRVEPGLFAKKQCAAIAPTAFWRCV